MYIVVDGIQDIGEGEVLSVVLGVVEAEHFGALSIVHVFGIVVIFVEELLDDLVVVVLLGHVDLVELQSAYLSSPLLQHALLLNNSDLVTLFIIIDNYNQLGKRFLLV
jgi:hypothetical protein